MAYKISVDQETCIGCGACTTCDNFELKDDGKANPKKTEVDNLTCEEDARDACPVQAIKVEEQ